MCLCANCGVSFLTHAWISAEVINQQKCRKSINQLSLLAGDVHDIHWLHLLQSEDLLFYSDLNILCFWLLVEQNRHFEIVPFGCGIIL